VEPSGRTPDGLPQPEPTAHPTSDTSRLETFADGVMAIAITLLVLEIRVPTHEPGGLGHALLDEWPSFAAYVTSFLTIGVIWVNHHRMFKLIERTTHSFLMLNIVFLMVVSFIPFPTALVATSIKAHDGVRVATFVYGGTMVVLAIMFNLVWGYASAGQRLLVRGLDPESLRKGTASYRKGPLLYLVLTLPAIFNPFISLAAFAALAAYWLLPTAGPGG
jgi:TMEM175 potassium channel family protein